MGKIKVVLVNLFTPKRYATLGFALNVETLAGDLRGQYKDEVEVEILDMQQGLSEGGIIESIKDKNPDILGISVKTGDRQAAKNILDRIYSKSFPKNSKPKFIILGGHRPRVFPEEFVNRYKNILVCQSEGEPAMRGLVDFIKGKKASLEEIPNLVFKRGGNIIKTPIQGLDLNTYNLPSLDTLQYVLKNNGMIYWESSRHCTWGKCTFCNRVFSKSTVVRTVPLEIFLDGWERLYKAGVRHVYMSDDDFMLHDADRMINMARGIIERGIKIKFWAQTRSENIYSSKATQKENGKKLKAAKLLKKAGFRRIFFGIEAVSPSQMQRYNKGIDMLSVERAIEIVRKSGIQLEAGFIPIDPLVTFEELKETINFIEKNKLEKNIVRILNVMCMERGTVYFRKTELVGLISGERNIDTLLYPYNMKNPAVEPIREIIERWYGETLHFIYPLRRIVDASAEGVLEEKYLHRFRKMDFILLKELVRFYSADSLKGKDRDINAKLFLGSFRNLRDSLIKEISVCIEKGRIKDEKGFLRKGIAEITESRS